MIIAAGLRHSVAELFSGMSIASYVLLFIGLMLIVVEFFQPAYGIATACGGVLTACGITVRMLAGGTLLMLFFMLLFCVCVLLAAHMIMLATQKKAWLTQALALKLEHAVHRDDSGTYSFLLGRDGVATTDISENGHIIIDDINFFVTGDRFIAKGSAVRVVRVVGDHIMVTAVNEDDDG